MVGFIIQSPLKKMILWAHLYSIDYFLKPKTRHRNNLQFKESEGLITKQREEFQSLGGYILDLWTIIQNQAIET